MNRIRYEARFGGRTLRARATTFSLAEGSPATNQDCLGRYHLMRLATRPAPLAMRRASSQRKGTIRGEGTRGR